MAVTCLTSAVLSVARDSSAEEEWQINAKSCITDDGRSGQAYMAACVIADQYDSVLFCQSGDDNRKTHARDTIERAGRKAVNDYMKDKAPGVCVD